MCSNRSRPPWAWNKALMTRNLWNIHLKKDSLWIKWIHSEFLQHNTIWDWTARKRESPLFKRLLDIRDFMLNGRTREEVAHLWAKWDATKGTAEAYEWFRPKGERKLWPRFIWKDFVPPKFSFTTWQAMKGRLATRDRLGYLNSAQECPLCLTHTESAEHLFFKCSKTREVWTTIKTWLGLRRLLSSIPSAIKWMTKERVTAVIRKARRLALTATVSLTWRARNAVVHEGTTFEPRHIVFEVKKITYATLYTLYPQETVQHYLGI